MNRGVASGGERVTECIGAQRSGGSAIAYWPSGAPGLSIRVVGRSPKEEDLPNIRRSF